jgi:bacillopeptidase F (M6 metalloprotease family)
MPYGYTGNILQVDLSSKKHWIENPPENFYRTYWSSPDKTDTQLSDHGHFLIFLRTITPEKRM